MSIQQAAEEIKGKAQAHLGDKFSIITGDMERVRTSGTVDHALSVGQSVPEFTLPDAFGTDVSLDALLASGPVVISFYRGEWCPFCNIELRGLQEKLPEIQKFGASLIAISPEKPDHEPTPPRKTSLPFRC